MQKHVALYEEYKNPWADEVSSLEMDRAEVDFNNFPKQIESKLVDVSPEDKEQMKDLGFDPAVEINDHLYNGCTIMYTVNAVYDRYGIEDIDFEVKGIRMSVEYSIWDAEADDEIWHEIELEDGGDFSGRVEFEVESLPFYPSNVEIDMHGGFDVSKFTYKVRIGN